MTNPPYGERLDADEALFAEMAGVFTRLTGRDVDILAGTPAIERAMRLRPVNSYPVWNGTIECRLLCYEIR